VTLKPGVGVVQGQGWHENINDDSIMIFKRKNMIFLYFR